MASDTPQRRPWTLMIYMAGDNGKVFDSEYGKLKLMDPMTTAGKSDLAKIGTIGTTDHAAVTCLLDTDQGVTYLVEVQRNGLGLAGSNCRRLPGVNTGDPKVLQQFIVESVRPLSGRSLWVGDLESRHRLAGCQCLRDRAGARSKRPFVQEKAGGPVRRHDPADRVRRFQQGLPGHRRFARCVRRRPGRIGCAARSHRHGCLPYGNGRGRAGAGRLRRLLRRLTGNRADGRLAICADPRRDEQRAGHHPA